MTEKGLADVVAAQTAISDIDGKLGKLWYAGLSIDELAENSSFEEVMFLVHHLRLPSQSELDELTEQMVEYREAGDFILELMPTLAAQTSPMSMLRTGVSAASAYDPDGWDQSPPAVYRKAVRITSLIPTLIAFYDRHRRGLDIVEPNPKLPHAANFLYMLTGEEPSQEAARAFDQTFILYVDHTMNASTFTARVVASTGADVSAALSAAIGAMSGPLHGGAPSRVLGMIEEVERRGDAVPYVKELLDNGDRLMGFGHRVYRAEDPRARVLRRTARELGAPRYEVAEALEKAALTELRERRPDRVLETNVEFWAAIVLDFADVPAHMFTSMFTCARTGGWSAHILEQKRTGRLIRPSAVYVGPAARPADQVAGWKPEWA